MSAPTADSTATPEAPRDDSFPGGIPYIVGNEGAERFSFYGMRAILYVYLTSLFLRFVDEHSLPAAAVTEAKAHATEVTHLFMAGVYAFPMIGAILADRLLGKYRVIFWISLIYVGGHAMLAFAGRAGAMRSFSFAETGMYIGLAMIAVGSDSKAAYHMRAAEPSTSSQRGGSKALKARGVPTPISSSRRKTSACDDPFSTSATWKRSVEAPPARLA